MTTSTSTPTPTPTTTIPIPIPIPTTIPIPTITITNPKTNQQETRGRPRKNMEEKLPEISRRLFSEHHGVFYTTCLLYVQEIFEELPNYTEKHHHYSSCGFAIYDNNKMLLLEKDKDKVNVEYSFENIVKDCEEWNLTKTLSIREMIEFVKITNGSAPKVVFYEILLLIEKILKLLELLLEEEEEKELDKSKIRINSQQQESREEEESKLKLEKILSSLLHEPETTTTTSPKYKYITFTYEALKEIGLERYYESHHIKERVDLLWGKFVKVIVYTVYCVVNHIEKSRYYPLFFESYNCFNSNSSSGGKEELTLNEIADWFDHHDKKGQENQYKCEEQQEDDHVIKSPNSNKLLSKTERKLEEQKEQKELLEAHHHNYEEKPITTTIKSRFQPILLSNELQEEHEYIRHSPVKKIKLEE